LTSFFFLEKKKTGWLQKSFAARDQELFCWGAYGTGSIPAVAPQCSFLEARREKTHHALATHQIKRGCEGYLFTNRATGSKRSKKQAIIILSTLNCRHTYTKRIEGIQFLRCFCHNLLQRHLLRNLGI
jgi:hypothetical protein